MADRLHDALTRLQAILPDTLDDACVDHGTLSVVVPMAHWLNVTKTLRDHPELSFQTFIDLSGVDYLHYGLSEWQTHTATAEGYDRAVDEAFTRREFTCSHPRFAVVLHVLSIEHRLRLRAKVFLPDESWLRLPSLVSIWHGANWFEREAYDLFGIEFEGHPDLRRILTDYGFQGHPFRKDFPLVGEVEMRYDAESAKCVYEPVSVQPRVTVPKVLRNDHRYLADEEAM